MKAFLVLMGLMAFSASTSHAQIAPGCCAVCRDGSMLVAGTGSACNELFGVNPYGDGSDFDWEYVCRDHGGTRSLNVGGPTCQPWKSGDDEYFINFDEYDMS